ncbi:unnamed protein product [Vitrella brassicaformis CCMP3155]|uniref:RING-type domain-containing protein n=1 Tax=Vitrella brassicaformis (strain CCMP3155) TaxID=1169540 RepID=A0A0G4GKK8_VITBC|nr:unnamed protein product [Vitrella brassicaformis CCMP3155]|eukprot:CEM30528.1 unnamed protein product [Vitrella brassicaformis CCMP3155]
MRKGSREPQLSESDIDPIAADLLSADPSTLTARARKLCGRLTRQQGQHLAARLLEDKDGLRRMLARLLDGSNQETQLAAADLLLYLIRWIKPALAALQRSQLADVAAVFVDVVTWKEAAEGGSRCYGPDESLAVKEVLKADAAVDVVTYVRLLFLASVLEALHAAAPEEGARLRDLVLAGHQTTIKQCLKVIRTDTHGSLSSMASFALSTLLLPFTPPPSRPEVDLTPVPLQLSLPLFSLLVDHLLKLVEGAIMDPQGWRRTLELPGLVAGAASQRQSTSLREKDVERLAELHLCAHVELTLMGIISSGEGGALAVAAATLGAIMVGVLKLSEQFDSLPPFPMSSCRTLLDNPSLIMTAIKAASAPRDREGELTPAVCSLILGCLKIPAQFAIDSGDIDSGHRVVEALCQLLTETVAACARQRLLVFCIVKLLEEMIEGGHQLVTKGMATSNPFVDQIVQCEAIQQLRDRLDLSAEVSSFIDSLPKTASAGTSSAGADRSHGSPTHMTTTHTHHGSGPPSPPHPSTSSGGLDGLEDGLFSDDIGTVTAAVRGIADHVTTAVADQFGKRLVRRFAKERTAFRRFLMRLVDSSGVECQVAVADLLDIFEIITWKQLEEGGADANLGSDLKSAIAYAFVQTSSADEPPPSATSVVTFARLCLIKSALEAATDLEAAGGPQLRASFLQSHQTTLRQVMDVICERRHARVVDGAVMMLQKLFEPSPFGPSFQLVLEFFSICVEILKQLTNERPVGTCRFLLPLMCAAEYLRDSQREGIVEEWPAIKAALNTHVYAHMDTLVALIKASDPSSRLCFTAISTVGALLLAAIAVCIRKKKGVGAIGEAKLIFVQDAIEQHGVGKIMAAAPLPMQSLRRFLLDAAIGDKVLNALDMDHTYEGMPISLGLVTATALLILAMAMIDGGEAGLLVESGFMSTLISLLDSAERIGSMVVLSMDCLKTLIQRDRKVLGTDGLAEAICDMLRKDAQGHLSGHEWAGMTESHRGTAVSILKSIVSYGKSQVRKGAPNPIVGQILQLESVKAMRNPTSGIEVSRQVYGFFNSLAQQHEKDTKAKPKTAMTAAQLAAQEAKAKRMQEALLAEERREKEAKEKKGKGKKNKGGKGQQQQQQQEAAGGDAASPSDVVIEPSVPSTAASTSRASAAEEVEASQPEPSSSIADTSGASGVPSVSAAAGSDRPGDDGDAVKSAAGGSDGDSDNEDGDAMLLKSAFGQHARQQLSEGHKKRTKGKHATRPTPTPTPQPSQPPRPSLPPAIKTNQMGRPSPAANEDRYRGGNGPIRMPAHLPLSSAQFPKGRFKMSPGNEGLAPPLPKRPSRPLLSDDDSPSGGASPPFRPVEGRGAGRGLMTMFAHQPSPVPSIPFPRLPSAEELRNRPSLQRHTRQDDQQQPTRDEGPRPPLQQHDTRDEWQGLSTAGPSLSRFHHAPVGPAPPAGGGGGLRADPFYDNSGGDDMYVPRPPAFPPIDPSGFHRMGPPLPVSYNGGPQASGAPSAHPFGFPQPFPSSPTPAAAAAAAASGSGGRGLSADLFYDSEGDDMYCVPPPPAFPPPPPPHPPIDPSDFHPIGSPLPVSYNGGPQASGFSPHPLGIHQPFPSSPTPAAAAPAAPAAGGGGGLSANPFYDDNGADDMYVPPPPPIFEYEEEAYQPPSSSSAAAPFAAAQADGTVRRGNGGQSTGFGATMMGGGASGSEQLVDQLCRQLEQKDQEAKRRAREARRRTRELQEAKQKEQEARRSEEALIRRLQEAEWQLSKMAAQQSSHHQHPQPPSSSSSSAPPRPSSSSTHSHPPTHANTTDQQPHDGDGDDSPACVICFGEHGPASVMYIPCRHMHICTKCYADRRRAWRQNLPRLRAENARRVEVNKELIKEDKEPMAMLPEGYLCEQCQTEVAFAGSVSEVAQWSTRPFVTGAS